MKKILYIICMAVVTTFASCQKDADVEDNLGSNGAVAFSAESIASLTRVSGSEWEEDDEIGIFAINISGCSYDNVKYTTTEAGTKVSLSPTSEVIYHPEDGSTTVYMAYFPYQVGWSYTDYNMIFDLSAQDGTAEAQSKVDLLISAEICESEDEELAFQFEHSLSKVQITVSNHEEFSAFEDLSALTATLYTKRTQYDVLDEEVVLSTQTSELKMVETSNDGTTAVFTVIIAPGEVSNEEIIFTDGDNSYTATLAIDGAVEGKQYNFTATVGDRGITLVELEGDSVTNWESQEDTSLSSGIEIVDGVYQISTADELALFAQLVNSGNTAIDGKLTGNINLNGSVDNLWSAIGTYDDMYEGTFDGGGFEVSGLYQSGQAESGFIYATNGAVVKNLTVSGEISCEGGSAGVVSFALKSTVISCHNGVDITATSSMVGGVVGYAMGSAIVNCYNSGDIISSQSAYIGGIVGCTVDYNDDLGSIINCYNVGEVSGSNSYGAIAGWPEISGEISNCYYLDSSCTYGRGDSYNSYDYITSMSSEDMQSTLLLYHLNNGAYTYNQTSPTVEAYAWKAVENDYPTFDSEGEATYTQFDITYNTTSNIYQIYTGDGMRTFADLVNGSELSVSDVLIDNSASEVASYFVFSSAQQSISGVLMNDIDLGGIDENGEGIESNEFTAIGSDSPTFKGTFDGGGYEISGLYINKSTTSYQGLFGCASGATIKNVGVSGSITGYTHVGGVVGRTSSGSGTNSLVINCYSKVSVKGTSYVGGVVGSDYSPSSTNVTSIVNCYASGSVDGSTSYTGGILGSPYNGYTLVKYCYYNSTAYSGGSAIGYGTASITSVLDYSSDYMLSDDFVTTLNDGAAAYNLNNPSTTACTWVKVEDDYPALDVQ